MKTQVSLHRGGIAASPFRGRFPVKDTSEDDFAGIASIVRPVATASMTWLATSGNMQRWSHPIILNNLPMLSASSEIRKARKFPSIPRARRVKTRAEKRLVPVF